MENQTNSFIQSSSSIYYPTLVIKKNEVSTQVYSNAWCPVSGEIVQFSALAAYKQSLITI